MIEEHTQAILHYQFIIFSFIPAFTFSFIPDLPTFFYFTNINSYYERNKVFKNIMVWGLKHTPHVNWLKQDICFVALHNQQKENEITDVSKLGLRDTDLLCNV